MNKDDERKLKEAVEKAEEKLRKNPGKGKEFEEWLESQGPCGMMCQAAHYELYEPGKKSDG